MIPISSETILASSFHSNANTSKVRRNSLKEPRYLSTTFKYSRKGSGLLSSLQNSFLMYSLCRLFSNPHVCSKVLFCEPVTTYYIFTLFLNSILVVMNLTQLSNKDLESPWLCLDFTLVDSAVVLCKCCGYYASRKTTVR